MKHVIEGSLKNEISGIIAITYKKINEYIYNGCHGDLVLFNTIIGEFPKELKVRGRLCIVGCLLMEPLPVELSVDGDLEMDEICYWERSSNNDYYHSYFPKKLMVGGDCYLGNLRNLSLPDHLEIKGDLYVHESLINFEKKELISDPKILKIGKKIHSIRRIDNLSIEIIKK